MPDAASSGVRPGLFALCVEGREPAPCEKERPTAPVDPRNSRRMLNLVSAGVVHLWFEEVLRDKRIPHRIYRAGQRISEFDPVQIALLHPAEPLLRGPPRGYVSDVNSNSLVLAVRDGHVTLLLPGDIEDEAERFLLEREADLSAQVLKVPHHGGRTSSGLPFLEQVRPTVAAVSAGYRNRFGHPH